MYPAQRQMRRLWRGALLSSALSLSFVAFGAQGLTVTPMSLPELIKSSQLVVHGQVLSQEVTLRPRPAGRPWVYTLGGEVPSSGAGLPPLRLVIPGLPVLAQGQEAALFLAPKRGASMRPPQYVIVGGAQGLRAQSV